MKVRWRRSELIRGVTRRAIVRGMAAVGVAGGLVVDVPAARVVRAQQQEGDAMEPVITHLNPEEMHSNPAFSQAVVVEGNARTIYVGGQDAVDASGAIVGAGDLAAQTEQVFANLETVLAAAGATLHDIIKWNIYVVQGQDFGPGFQVFQQKWGTSAPTPAITGVIVAGLANSEFLVEIDAVAVVGASPR